MLSRDHQSIPKLVLAAAAIACLAIITAAPAGAQQAHAPDAVPEIKLWQVHVTVKEAILIVLKSVVSLVSAPL